MTTKAFMRPRLTGARFSGHSIPLEFLKDLAVLEEMIIEVAKAEYLKDNPGRKRSPRGFSEGIGLKLTGIEDGSAVPVISLVVAAASLFPQQNEIYFERARDSVVEAISAAEEGGHITEYLPEKTLGYFDRFGRSLREGEAIEFETPNTKEPARLTRESRRKLLASSSIKEFTEETVARVSVPEMDQDRMTCQLQFPDGHKVGAAVSEPHIDTVMEAFNGYKTGLHVLVQGVARFNRSNRLIDFDSIEHVSVLDPLDIRLRLDQLALLKDGWLEGDGVAPAEEGLQWLAENFDQYYPDELPLPYLYPLPEGGVQVEWSFEGSDVTLEIDLDSHTGDWHSLDTASDEEISKNLDLSEPQSWEWLIKEIQRISGSVA